MADLVTLTMNPAIDIATSVEAVVSTVKLRCGFVRRSPGGGGVNVARVVSRLGQGVVALFPAGGPIGERLTDLVAAEGIRCRVVPIRGETRESFTALEDRSGAEYRFVLPGPVFAEEEVEAVVSALAALHAAAPLGFVVLSGSLPEGVSKNFYARAAATVGGSGTKIVLDTYGEALALALEAGGIALIKPSLRELSDLVGRQLPTQKERLAACREVLAAGGVEWIALTQGAEGAMLVGDDFALFAPALPVEVKSAVGAGDSFLGAMVAALAEGRGHVDAFRQGIAAGSAALLTPGTSLCLRQDVERLAPHVVIRDLGGR